jgi:hypothetical protein
MRDALDGCVKLFILFFVFYFYCFLLHFVAFPTSLKARFSNQNITFCWLVPFWEYAGPCQGANLQVKGRESQENYIFCKGFLAYTV